jgi:hypothetical protein
VHRLAAELLIAALLIITQDGRTWTSAAVRAQGREFSGF